MLKIGTIVLSSVILALILLNIFSLIRGDMAHTETDLDLETTTPEQETIVEGIEAEEFEVTIVEEGEGEGAKDGDTLVVHYTGRLLDGTVFDSSLDRGEPFEFVLGQDMVIKGWEEGMQDMKVGEERNIIIPSEMGYGEMGSPPTIPGSAGLEFDVELLEIKN